MALPFFARGGLSHRPTVYTDRAKVFISAFSWCTLWKFSVKKLWWHFSKFPWHILLPFFINESPSYCPTNYANRAKNLISTSSWCAIWKLKLKKVWVGFDDISQSFLGRCRSHFLSVFTSPNAQQIILIARTNKSVLFLSAHFEKPMSKSVGQLWWHFSKFRW